ncbi:MAG: penicillin-binding protein activator [Alphaproteobacteria bacterium]|nr:MAG: penicillin-binding protein activator [Alphaproteobacteria bacterium]TAF12752.1 MAG: penicillin-binding protein activator [Alphaproteobacteria bacterium]TAF41966.1 MAG: penicillin-binding protein activator [Alphaproteobacteria bacterium]TAF76574.1 MAG: penicillin-binding protein activator [Alphaproteobacteria bacterium]
MIQGKNIRMRNLFILTLVSMVACKPMPPSNDAGNAIPPSPYHASQQTQIPVSRSSLPAPANSYVPAPQVRYQHKKVAFLVPLSAPSAEIGKAMLDAAMLGLFDVYANAPVHEGAARIQLMPYDTPADPKLSAKVAQEAIDDGAQVIIGPLYASSVAAVAPIAKRHNIPMINFSNNIGVTGAGNYTLGFMPAEQVLKVLDATMARGDKKIAALLPASPYGDVVEEAVIDHTDAHATELVGVAHYPLDGSNIAPYVQRLIGNTSEKDPLPFDALVVAEGGETFIQLLKDLKKFRVTPDKVHYLGTGLLDDRSLLGIADGIGTWYATTPSAMYEGFSTRFEAEYDYRPPRLASLGYDAVALVAYLLEQGGVTETIMTRYHGFELPANGLIRFHQDGSNQRSLAVMALGAHTMEEIMPAQRVLPE